MNASGLRVGVLVHGYNLHAKNWDHVVWGDPPNYLGRLPRAVQVMIEEDADVIAFGTGASEKNKMKEAEYIFNFLLRQWPRLQDFSAFKHAADKLDMWHQLIRDRAQLDMESRCTADEVRICGWIFQAHRIQKVILVSSPDHISRCLRDALITYHGCEFYEALFPHNVLATASQTYYTVPGVARVEIREHAEPIRSEKAPETPPGQSPIIWGWASNRDPYAENEEQYGWNDAPPYKP